MKFLPTYDAPDQKPDPRPGNYYVSAIDDPQSPNFTYWLLLGPFGTQQEALDRVDEVKALATRGNPRADFYAYGTVRMADDYNKPGSANRYLLKDAA